MAIFNGLFRKTANLFNKKTTDFCLLFTSLDFRFYHVLILFLHRNKLTNFYTVFPCAVGINLRQYTIQKQQCTALKVIASL